MRFEIATVREKQRERCMQTAKGMHVKVRFEKVIRCYWGRRKRTNCQRHTNSLPLQNVTHVKKYLERDYNVLPATSKSTDASEAQRATQSLSNQESRETVNVSSERASEDGPLEYTRSDDATMEQRDSVTLRPTRVKRLPSKFIQLDSEQNFKTFRTGTLNWTWTVSYVLLYLDWNHFGVFSRMRISVGHSETFIYIVS